MKVLVAWVPAPTLCPPSVLTEQGTVDFDEISRNKHVQILASRQIQITLRYFAVSSLDAELVEEAWFGETRQK